MRRAMWCAILRVIRYSMTDADFFPGMQRERVTPPNERGYPAGGKDVQKDGPPPRRQPYELLFYVVHNQAQYQRSEEGGRRGGVQSLACMAVVRGGRGQLNAAPTPVYGTGNNDQYIHRSGFDNGGAMANPEAFFVLPAQTVLCLQFRVYL